MSNEATNTSPMEFKDRLKILREIKGFKQREIADYIGVTRTTISGYETKGYQPSHEKLLRIARKLDVSIDYLVAGGPEDIELRRKYNQTHKELAMEIAQSCSGLSYDNKIRIIEYAHYLEYLEESEALDD